MKRRKIIAYSWSLRPVRTSLTAFKRERDLVFCVIYPDLLERYRAEILDLVARQDDSGGVVGVDAERDTVLVRSASLNELRRFRWDKIDAWRYLAVFDGESVMRYFLMKVVAMYKRKEPFLRWLKNGA